MCTVSAVGDYYRDRWIPIGPSYPQHPFPPGPIPDTKSADDLFKHFISPVTREEFDNLKKEVLEMKELLKKALDIDKATKQPDCYMDEKVKLLKKIAEVVGVSLEDVFGEKKSEQNQELPGLSGRV